MPPGVSGTVLDVRVFSRRGVEKDERALQIERSEVEFLRKDRDDERSIIERFVFGRLNEILLKKEAIGGPKGLKAGQEITPEVLNKYNA